MSATAALQPDGFSGEQQHPSQHRPERWSTSFRKCTGKVWPGIVGFFESERLASLRLIGWRFWSGIRSQKVKYGEFDATVVKICVGSLSGMIDIRVQGGLICVGVTEVTRDRPGASEEAPVEAPTRYEEQNAAEKIDGYYVPTPCEDAQHNTQPDVERARVECVKALERKIEQISRLSIDKFFALTGRKSGTRAKQSPTPIEVKRGIKPLFINDLGSSSLVTFRQGSPKLSRQKHVVS